MEAAGHTGVEVDYRCQTQGKRHLQSAIEIPETSSGELANCTGTLYRLVAFLYTSQQRPTTSCCRQKGDSPSTPGHTMITQCSVMIVG